MIVICADLTTQQKIIIPTSHELRLPSHRNPYDEPLYLHISLIAYNGEKTWARWDGSAAAGVLVVVKTVGSAGLFAKCRCCCRRCCCLVVVVVDVVVVVVVNVIAVVVVLVVLPIILLLVVVALLWLILACCYCF